MKKISQYDERQLKLLYENLKIFEENLIELSSLIGSLEFLFYSLESVENEWEKKFLEEISTLESINALEIIKNAGEEINEMNKKEKEKLIKKAISNLKNLIEEKLNTIQ